MNCTCKPGCLCESCPACALKRPFVGSFATGGVISQPTTVLIHAGDQIIPAESG